MGKKITLRGLQDMMHGQLVLTGINKPSTLATKMSKLKVLFARMTGRADVLDLDAIPLLRDVPGILACLEQSYKNKSTMLSMLTPVISAIDCVGMNRIGLHPTVYQLLHEKMRELDEIRSKHREDNPEPEYLKANRELTFAALEAIDLTAVADDRDRLIVALYTCLPPRRLEYARLQFKSDEAGDLSLGNFAVLDPPCLVLNDYKTDGTYGQVRIPLTSTELVPRAGSLAELLRASFMKEPRQFVFDYPDVRPDEFSKMVRQAFANCTPWSGITVRLIRKLYATHIASGRPLTTADRKQLAHLCGHDFQQSDTYKMIDRMQQDYDHSKRDYGALQAAYEELLREYEMLALEIL